MTLLARGLFALFALMLACAAHAQARDSGLDTALTIEEQTQHFTVAEDGSFVAVVREVLRIDEERAIRAVAQRYVSYNSSLETIEITEAYTQKADGRRLNVAPEQIKDQQEPRSTGAPMFQDTRLKVMVFPDVSVGDKLVYAVLRRRTTPLWPGQFEDRSAPPFNPIDRFELTYDMPASKPLFADASGFEPQRVDSPPGRKVYRWKHVRGDMGRIETASVAYSDYGHRLVVSTFPDWSAFGRAYDERALPQSQPGDAARALALKLTLGMDDPRTRALALADWVRRNVRYVAVYIGPGGVVPHAADSVLENRYGDCKDHVALLEALLAAAGIDSTPALINLGNAYQLGSVPSLGVLNHVITYVPSLELFLDSTAENVSPGFLPPPDVDKPVLLTRSGRVARTPTTMPAVLTSITQVDVDARGGAHIRQEQTHRGWLAEPNRALMRSLSPTARNAGLQRMLQLHGQTGQGTLEVGDLSGVGDTYVAVLDARSSNMVNLPGPVGWPVMSSLSNNVALAARGLLAERERTQLFICPPQDVSEKAVIRFPKDVTVLAVPKAVQVNVGPLEYASRYVQSGNEVSVERRLVMRTTGALCEPKLFRTMGAGLEAMSRDLKSQIVLQGS